MLYIRNNNNVSQIHAREFKPYVYKNEKEGDKNLT